jgi:hypothetical protein
MAIRILKSTQAAGGCLLTFVPDAEDAPLFLARACRVFGWAMGIPAGPDAGGALTAFVRGATSASFRAEFDGMPEFDFSGCQEDTAACRAGPEGGGTVIIDP